MPWRKLIGSTEEGATQVKELASTKISATVTYTTSLKADKEVGGAGGGRGQLAPLGSGGKAGPKGGTGTGTGPEGRTEGRRPTSSSAHP